MEEVTMNKAGLTAHVANETGLSKKDAGIAIASVLGGIKQGLVEDGKVTLVKFGTFELYERKARKGHNPKTGEALDIPAKTAMKFRVSKDLKDGVSDVDLADIGAKVEVEDAE
jgi:DNA-binding protein HU-beta